MKLNKDELIEYAKKSLENAKELIEEGNLLLENEKYARAFTLFQLSIEETGASLLIIESILLEKYNKRKEQNALLGQIRNHKIKIKSAQKIDLVLALAIKDETLKKTFLKNYIKQSSQIDNINNYKKNSLYVSLIKGKVVKPSVLFDKSIVDDFKFFAEIRCEATKQYIDALIDNFDEIIEEFKTLDYEEFSKNPPQQIKDLIKLVENT